MDFTLDKKHEMARSLFREFAENEVKPLAQETDETEQFPAETVKKMAKYGFMGLIHIHGDEIRLDMTHLHDIAGGFVIRVVGKKHQNVKGGLRQLQLAAKRLAGGGIGAGKFMGKFLTGVHTQDSFSNNAKLNSSNLN